MLPESTNIKSPLEAAKIIYETLEPLDEEIRLRVITSALTLLGMTSTGLPTNQNFLQNDAGQQFRQTGERPVSPIELIQEKNPSNNVERLALFAYYREKYEGLTRFAKNDLKSYFSKFRLPPAQNFDRDFRDAVQAGYIYEDGSESYLTSKGLEAVESKFTGKPQQKAKPKKADATKKPTKKA